MRRIRQWLLRGLLLLILLLAMSLTGTYFVLRSPAALAWLIPRLAPTLESAAGIRVTADYARIDLLRGFRFQGLTIDWQDAQMGRAHVQIAAAELDYSLRDLFERRLHLRQLEVTGLALAAELDFTAPSAEQPDAPRPGQPFTISDIANRVATPPLAIELERIRLQDSQIDLQLKTAEQTLQYRSTLALTTSAEWTAAGLQLDADLQTGQPQRAASSAATSPLLTIQDPDHYTLSTQPTLAFKFAAALSHTGDNWQFQLEPINQQLELAALRYDTPGDAGLSMHIDSLTWQSRVTAQPPQSAPTGLVGALPQRAAAQSDLMLNGLQLEQSQPAGGLKAELDQLRITANLDGQRPGTAIWPLQVSGDSQLQIAGFDVDGPLTSETSTRLRARQTLGLRWQSEILDWAHPLSKLDLQLTQQLDLAELQFHSPDQGLTAQDLGVSVDAQMTSGPATESGFPGLRFQAKATTRAAETAFRQTEAQTGTDVLTARLQPLLEWVFHGQVDNPAKPLESLAGQLSNHIELTAVDLKLNDGQTQDHYRLPDNRITTQANIAETTLDLTTQAHLKRAKLPQLAQPVTIQTVLNASSERTLRQPQLALDVDLDDMPLLTASIQATDAQQRLELAHQFALQLPPRLANYHAAAGALAETGELHLKWRGDSQLEHGQGGIAQADTAALAAWPIASQGQLSLTQVTQGASELQLDQPLQVTYQLNQSKDYAAELSVSAPSVQYPPLAQPAALGLVLAAHSDWPPTQTRSSGQLTLDNAPVLDWQLSAHNAPGTLKLETMANAQLDPAWQRYYPDLAALEPLGQWAANLSLAADLQHTQASALELSANDLSTLATEATLDAALRQRNAPAAGPLQLAAPVQLKQTTQWSAKALQSQTDLRIPQLDIPATLSSKALHTRVNLTTDHGLQPQGATLDLHVTGERLSVPATTPEQSPLDLAPLVFPTQVYAQAQWNDQEATLQTLSLEVADQLLQLAANGTASLDGQQLQLAGELGFNPRASMLTAPAVAGSGTFHWPWRVTLSGGNRLGLESTLNFDNFSLSSQHFRLRELNGQINLAEELILTPDGQARFVYRVNADPFQRVDFDRIQPYLDERVTLRLEGLQAGEQHLGPLLANISLEQNLLRLSRLDLDLFGGHLAAGLYLDASPGAWGLGFIVRISQVDLRPLLPERSDLSQADYAPISARAALDFDLAQLLLEGRVDITDISRVQLLQIMDVIDPGHEDNQLAQLRSALRFSYPQRVTIIMRHSLMDMAVKLAGLGAPVRVRGLPLSSLLQRFVGDYIRMLDNLPLTE